MSTPRKSFLLLLTTFFFCALLQAQVQVQPAVEIAEPAPELPATPVTTISFTESTFDFGTVISGEKIARVFTFTNTGEEPLLITDAKGSCGCTVPQWPREPLAPGETASITVEFNSKNKFGKRSQKVTLTANTDPPQNFIYLTGEVLKGEETEESMIQFLESEVERVTDKAQPQTPAAKSKPVENPNCFAIYPNPTAERLVLDMEKDQGKTAMVRILSQSGQLMAQREIKALEARVEFQVGHFPAGTYYAHVAIEGRKPDTRCFLVVK